MYKIRLFVLYSYYTLYLMATTSSNNALLFCVLTLPISSWLIVLVHELSHWLCFRLFGFNVTGIRIGLFIIDIVGNSLNIKIAIAGFFRGYCTVNVQVNKKRNSLIFSLMAGGISGLLISVGAFMLIISNTIPKRWRGALVSLICVGIYSFYATLLSPRSADRKLIKKILKE